MSVAPSTPPLPLPPPATGPRAVDVLILGGGIVGTAVARDATLRGLTVALLEERTIGWGTSSRSSRLVHGGIRYLETGDLRLVFEALRERATLLATAPALVRPLSFHFVLETSAWWPRVRLGLGVLLYRALAGRHALGAHRPLSRQALLRREPLLAASPITGGAVYQDATCDDLGLVRALAADAVRHGALVHEHCTAHLTQSPHGVVATLSTGERLMARSLVLAVGPWTDRVRGELGLPTRELVGGTKGVHLTVPLSRLPLEAAVTLRHPRDGRVMFCIPEPTAQRVVIGTTDTETKEPPEALTTDPRDLAYLLEAVQHTFPAQHLTIADVVDTWVGVRPLLRQHGDASRRSREHAMLIEGHVLTIAGGKLTTHRAMAEAAVDHLGRMLHRRLPRCRTARIPLPAVSAPPTRAIGDSAATGV